MTHFPVEALKVWFMQQRRGLPWRHAPTPYAVWISEVMLQQTQVRVVIPYFLRWMEKFPSVEGLAKASLDEVIKAWEGLGYYSRARYLHAAACQIVKEYGGEIPATVEALSKIKGMGPYTRGALLNFAFHQRAVAIDANVVRVLTRYYGITSLVSQRETQRRLHTYLEALLPYHEPWVVTEALIELGALVCTKRPACAACPLAATCWAHREGCAETLPCKKPASVPVYLTRLVAVVITEGAVLVQRRAQGKVMAGLYEFPYVEKGEMSPTAAFTELLARPLYYSHALTAQRHAYTHHRVTLEPYVFRGMKLEEDIWCPIKELDRLPFSSGHRRIACECSAF